MPIKNQHCTIPTKKHLISGRVNNKGDDRKFGTITKVSEFSMHHQGPSMLSIQWPLQSLTGTSGTTTRSAPLPQLLYLWLVRQGEKAVKQPWVLLGSRKEKDVLTEDLAVKWTWCWSCVLSLKVEKKNQRREGCGRATQHWEGYWIHICGGGGMQMGIEWSNNKAEPRARGTLRKFQPGQGDRQPGKELLV